MPNPALADFVPNPLSIIIEEQMSERSGISAPTSIASSVRGIGCFNVGGQFSLLNLKNAVAKLAHRLAGAARPIHTGSASLSRQSESPRSAASSVEANLLNEPTIDDMTDLTSLSTDEHQSDTLEQFYLEAYDLGDQDRADVQLTDSGKKFDELLSDILSCQQNPQGSEADEACLYLLRNTECKSIRVPSLQQQFERDCTYLHNAYDRHSSENIDDAVKKNIRLWIRANILDRDPDTSRQLNSIFFEQINLDLLESLSESTGPGRTIPSPGEPPEALESEEYPGDQEFGHDESEGLTESASFSSISFDSGGLPQAEGVEAPNDAFSSYDPSHIPANLLAFDANPEMYSFWRLLGNVFGSVANAGEAEKNSESFKLLCDTSQSTASISKLQQVFRQDRDNLHLKFSDSCSTQQIDNAICKHIQVWLKANLIDQTPDRKNQLLNEFVRQVSESVPVNHVGREAESSSLTLTNGARKFADLPDSGHFDVLRSDGVTPRMPPGFQTTRRASGGAIGESQGNDVLQNPIFHRFVRLADLLPKANSRSLFASRRSEFSRLKEVVKSFSMPPQPFFATSHVNKTAEQPPVVDVRLDKKHGAIRSLNVKFATNSHQEQVKENAARLIEMVLTPEATEPRGDTLNTMFMAQLDNSGIDKHLYHKVIKQDTSRSGVGFRLSSQAHGGLMTSALPMLGPKKSLEQKALNRVNGRGGNRLSALTDTLKQFSKVDDKAFLTYMAHQQALWNQIKPGQLPSSKLLEVHNNGQRVHFHLLEQVGFNQKGLTPDQLIQIGKLVMSSVSAEVVRSPMSDADIDRLYANKSMRDNVPMPLNASQFQTALGPGRPGPLGGRNYGTLGSQLIDLMASMNSKRRNFIIPKDHHMLGNLLTLMVTRQASQQTNAVSNGKPSNGAVAREVFTNRLIESTKGNMGAAFRPYMKDDASMDRVLAAMAQSIQNGLAASAQPGPISDSQFLDTFRASIRVDDNLLAALQSGLIENLAPAAGSVGEISPQSVPENGLTFPDLLRNQVADAAHFYVRAQVDEQKMLRHQSSAGELQ